MNTIKILLVEDIEIIMKISTRLVENLGYHPDCATTAEAALELVKINNYDLILTDIGLPGMSGIELIAKIREHERKEKIKESVIYAVTAYNLKDISAECFSSGVNGVFNKPLQAQPLIKIIQDTYLHVIDQSYKQLVTT